MAFIFKFQAHGRQRVHLSIFVIHSQQQNC